MYTYSKTAKTVILYAMGISMFTLGFNTTSIINAIPIISTNFSMEPTSIQWILNIYTILTASLILIAGKLSDLFSKKYFFIIGSVFYLFASVIIAFSASSFQIILGRAFQGFSAAFITTSSLSILKTVFTEEEMGFAIGIWVSLIGIGNATGPFGGGFITDFFGWRYIFWLNFILLLFPLAVIVFLFKREFLFRAQKQGIDYIGFILFSIGMLLLVIGLTEVNIYGWENKLIYILIFSGAIILSVFYFYDKKISYPLLNFSYFKNKVFIVSVLGLSLSTFTAMLIPYFLNFYLQNPLTYNYTSLMAGIILFIFAGASFLGAGFSSFIIKLYGNRNTAFFALILLIVPFIYLGFFIRFIGIYQLSAILFLAGIGVGIIEPLFSTIGLNLFPQHESGQASGILNTGVYISELLAIVSGSIFFFIFGRIKMESISKYLDHGKNLGTHAVDKLLIGEHAAIKDIGALVNNTDLNSVLKVIKSSGIISFSSVIILTVVLSLIILVLCGRYLPGKHEI